MAGVRPASKPQRTVSNPWMKGDGFVLDNLTPAQQGGDITRLTPYNLARFLRDGPIPLAEDEPSDIDEGDFTFVTKNQLQTADGNVRFFNGSIYVKVEGDPNPSQPWHRLSWSYALGAIQPVVDPEGIVIS